MRHRPRNLPAAVPHVPVGPQQVVPVQLSGVVRLLGEVQQDFAKADDGRVREKNVVQAAVDPLQTELRVHIRLVRANLRYRLGKHRLCQGLLVDLLETDRWVFGQFRERGGVELGHEGHCAEEDGYAGGMGGVGGVVAEDGYEVGEDGF